MHYIYVLKSEKDEKLYYGHTTDMANRLKEHNRGEVRATKSRIPFKMVYFETVKTVQEARQREKYFKSGFGRKYVKNKISASSSNG